MVMVGLVTEVKLCIKDVKNVDMKVVEINGHNYMPF